VSLWSARMSDAISYRPMEEGDLVAVHHANMRAFVDLDRRLGHEYAGPMPELGSALIRLRRLLATDPGGAWVAERGGAIAGAALALLRERMWGLSLLFVDPAAQGRGVGRELLARARAYGDGARGFAVLSSSDPWAMRAYARLGLAMHPSVSAEGTPRVADPPAEVREGGPTDLPLTVEVDRAVRGAAHGDDVLAMLAAGNRMLVAPGRGYAILRGNEARLVAAFDEEGARLLLRGALARLGDGAFVQWITATQQWALQECLDAGLVVNTGAGCVFLGGDVGPFRPYLPTGSYL
jgi:GNAT superfamily N-acetyltransferase